MLNFLVESWAPLMGAGMVFFVIALTVQTIGLSEKRKKMGVAFNAFGKSDPFTTMNEVFSITWHSVAAFLFSLLGGLSIIGALIGLGMSIYERYQS